MGKSDNATEFLDLYRKLEGCIREHYDVPEKHGPVAWLGRNPGRAFKNVAGALKYCAEVRNLLSHQERVDGDYAVEPSDSMLTLLRNTLAAVENPPKAIDHAVSMQNVFSATVEDCVRPVLREMAEKCYTHVPILEDGIVRGVFSENTLLSYLYGEEIVCIDDETTFSSLAELLPVDAHVSESFRFVPRTITLTEVAEMFTVAMRRADRIGMVFITHSGKPSEKVLGIITAWDVAAYL